MISTQGAPKGFAKEKERLEREAAKGSPKDQPTTLRLGEIKTCPAVFQPRQGSQRDGAHYRDHVEALVHQLDTMPAHVRVLEPIVVYAVGWSFYVLDGHHRRAAYEAAGITEGIPVGHFTGTIDEAIREAYRLNSRVHLNLEKSERNEAAWRLVCIGETSKPRMTVDAIVEASRLGRRSVEKMRMLWRRLQTRYGEIDEFTNDHVPAVFESYREALEADRGEKREFTDEMREAMIDGMVDKLGKAFGKHAHRHTDEMGEALQRYLGEHSFKQMAEHLGYAKVDMDELEDFLVAKARGAKDPHSLHPA
ncbi:ParB/Srx family N-terminal domain-containing protein [Methylobacterium brachythecii]|uniref:ParB/Sulfiredoxin domain-containing protein n=1 Tax=Methylobacterium brachythecii TaxID=1176177 RepID=A0A7W6F7L7_9HYPH|nr:ParB/Srx family N-terminal domain-containing protein [Methylobacterium brachythecii]MBB3903592.1 hypothetical protein [Methylobacterium brachythecii]GLS44056.1 hypothetical protein GCM10007884_20430 [Methylobacterium brachythecii]